jgi:hypothetical protein
MNKILWTPPKELKPNIPLVTTKINNIYKSLIYFEYYSLICLIIENVILIYKIKFKENDLTFEFNTKRSLDFISYDEELIFTLKDTKIDQSSFSLVIGTNKANIFILNISIKDFYIEIVLTLNVGLNNYEVLGLFDGKLIITIDKNLFVIINKERNFIMQIDEDEKVISANLKENFYLIVFTNKNIYMVDYATDGRCQILIKTGSYYTSFIFNDKIYYIKESNTFAIFPIYDISNKFSIKLSAKNQINDLNFYKVLNVDENLTLISNEIESEIYFISKKFKLIHKEHILFDKSYFVFLNNSIIVLSINLISMSLKYKYCILNNNQSEVKLDRKSYLNKVSLNEIEEEFVNFNSKRQIILNKIKEENFKIKKLLMKLMQINEINYFLIVKELVCSGINKILSLYLNLEVNKSNFTKCEKYYKVIILECFVYKFGSKSLHLNNGLLKDYFNQLFKSKVQELMQISKRINDKITYSKLENIIKIV